MSKRLVVFVGYDSKSYELVRKLRLSYDLNNIELIHVPEPDESSLTDVSFPSIITEEVCNGRLIREEIRRLNEVRHCMRSHEINTYYALLTA